MVGGAAAPQSMIEGFQKRHGLEVLHAWGMTEMTPVGTVCRLKPHLEKLPDAERFARRATQGIPVPFVETRVVGDDGPVPADGKSLGELHVRGPWIAKSYFKGAQEAADKFTPDGWFRTGDVVATDGDGYVRIADRSKDLIKSGRRVDQLGGARERADGPPGRGRGRGGGGEAPEVGRAAARVRGAARGGQGDRAGPARPPRVTLRAVLAAGRLRVHGPESRGPRWASS